jgi:hypothetical protein
MAPATEQQDHSKVPRWSFGVLNPQETVDVPGTVRLLSTIGSATKKQTQQIQQESTTSSRKNQPTAEIRSAIETAIEEDGDDNDLKTTADGLIILSPQPDASSNDPLNWPVWRRDAALVCLGLYCMLGGGMTPLLAAGFTNIAEDYAVDVASVSLTTGLYMMGMGIGCVIVSPTAILFGKRPLYLLSAVLFLFTAVWCALSPNFVSLMLARILQGVALSPVEALPSATISEIFFLHERAFRIGLYTLMLLGGKNLIPLLSAAVIQSLGWRWVFW